MPQEFETRILNIDKDELVEKLEALGAKRVSEALQKRATFDYPDRRLDEKRAWIRVRDTGEKIEMAFKQHVLSDEKNISDVKEVEFEIPDMEKAKQFLLSIGLEQKGYQETRRLRYELDDLQFDIDEWPMLEPFVEIEGPSAERVMEGVKMLGYTPEDTFQGHAGDIYEMQGIDWQAMKEIKFE